MSLSELGPGQPGVNCQMRGREEVSRRGGYEASKDSLSEGVRSRVKSAVGVEGVYAIMTGV